MHRHFFPRYWVSKRIASAPLENSFLFRALKILEMGIVPFRTSLGFGPVKSIIVLGLEGKRVPASIRKSAFGKVASAFWKEWMGASPEELALVDTRGLLESLERARANEWEDILKAIVFVLETGRLFFKGTIRVSGPGMNSSQIFRATGERIAYSWIWGEEETIMGSGLERGRFLREYILATAFGLEASQPIA